MSRRVALCLLLLVGLLVGITLEPDSGTAASIGPPDVTGSTVGANYAKPLPRITTVEHVARATVPTLGVVLVLVLLTQAAPLLRSPADTAPRRSLLWARDAARRGPPAPLVG